MTTASFDEVRRVETSRAWQRLTAISPTTLYAIYDGARVSPELFHDLAGSHLPHNSLFGPATKSPLLEASPFCVHLGANLPAGFDFFARYWGESAAIFVSAAPTSDMRAVYKHAKSLLRVKLPTGGKALFRFYDPRVFRSFIPTCDESQWRMIRGDHKSIWCESEGASCLLEYGAEASWVTPTAHALAG